MPESHFNLLTPENIFTTVHYGSALLPGSINSLVPVLYHKCSILAIAIPGNQGVKEDNIVNVDDCETCYLQRTSGYFTLSVL